LKDEAAMMTGWASTGVELTFFCFIFSASFPSQSFLSVSSSKRKKEQVSLENASNDAHDV
jgi:hypothetical protein